MRKDSRNKIPLCRFHLLEKFSDRIDHGIFTRDGGVSAGPYKSLNVKYGIGDPDENVDKNRSLICGALGVGGERLISAVQTHGNNVAIVDEELVSFKRQNEEISDTDALVTNLGGFALMVQVADCQAILMVDPSRNVVAVAHAGWKGLVNDVAGATIKVMCEHFGCNALNIRVGVSPSLGPCCSYFTNPLSELPEDFHKYIDAENRVDLWKFGKQQLISHGISEGNIEQANICTMCGGKGNSKEIAPSGGSDFFSYRAEKGKAGRFGAVIMVV